ncbi:MAG: NUDIX hydrolase [Deltaproteobacteria bacterium]|nr:NUDIX hydrolase [Deltaproteobacteria bacterium]
MTVDLVVLTVLDADLKVLLIRRKEHPFQGAWALPGGFVRVGDAYDDRGESVEAAAHRELAEETGLPEGSAYLAQLHTFGAPDRDPRMRVISVAHYALLRPTLAPFVTAGTDAAEARWASLRADVDSGALPLAFDHAEMLAMAVRRVRDELDRTPVAFSLVPETFTVAELRGVHEAVVGETYDAGNFRRRFQRMVADGLIEEAPGKRVTGTKPAQVYRFSARGA